MNAELERLPKNTIRAKVTIPKEKVKAAYTETVASEVLNIEVPGFRKGKAPTEVAEKYLDPATARTRALEKLLDEAVGIIIKEHHLHPVVSPRVEINKFEPEEELSLTATFAERPAIKIGDYKTALGQVKEERESTFYGPDGQPITKKDGKTGSTSDVIEKAIEAVLTVTEAEIADILIDDEVNQMLSRLIDQTGRLGLTVEEYLKSAGKTAEGLKNEYRTQAERNLKTGLMLSEVAALEGIKVEEQDINDTISGAPDEESKKNLSRPESRLYLETVLRNNKTVQKLVAMMEQNRETKTAAEAEAGINIIKTK